MGREIRLANRPMGWPEAADFEFVETTVPRPADGQLLVRNLVMSVDPYMRNRMNAIRSYVPSYQIGHALEGGAVGRVIDSDCAAFAPGDLVVHDLGWRDYAVLDPARASRIDAPGISVNAHLGVLGMPGLTAHAGIIDIAKVGPGDTVFISSAAGAVGTIAGQIARLRGAAQVIGSTSSAEKVSLLERLGFDAAFNYRDRPIDSQLRKVAPEGIDVYFDNVGGEHLEAAISMMKPFGRIAACGMLSGYNSTDLAAGPRNLMQVIARRLTVRGFLVDDYVGVRESMIAELASWLREERLTYHETIIDGLSRAPEALVGLLRGAYAGKVLVTIPDGPDSGAA